MSVLAANLENRLLWAVLVGWILTVVLHEFAHGIVAHWGGDYTIRERGGLTLNPLQYVDPFMSIILPGIILLIGGIPLPGGVTYIRKDLLRNRGWEAAVSLAGPAMNVLLFLLCVIPLHPAVGWVDLQADVNQWSDFQIFLGTMAYLQLVAVILNLVPIPPLDGFQAIAPFLPDVFREKVTTPPISTFLFFGYFFAVWQSSKVQEGIFWVFYYCVRGLGFGEGDIGFFFESWAQVFRG